MKSALTTFSLLAFLTVTSALGQPGSELRLCLRHDPKTFDGLLVDEEAGESIRMLTGGVLIRTNRTTQKAEPELATSWKLLKGGRTIQLNLRAGVKFSDGTPFSAEDVVFTMRRLMDPKMHSPASDAFRSGTGEVQTSTASPLRVDITFPEVVAGLERLFDQVPIQSARSPKKESAGLGPFTVSEYKAGSYILLKKNLNYWKRGGRGQQLPYLQSIRIDIQSNRDLELLRFRRGEIDMVSALEADAFDRLKSEMPAAVSDIGPSYDTEMVWFNQVRTAPLPAHKKAWFISRAFRQAVSQAINRDDIARLVYRGHAQPSVGPFSAANRLWFNPKLKPQEHAPADALRTLENEGFKLMNGQLRDRAGNPVEFSLITNAGNKARARIASILQQDLGKIGIRVIVTPLDFPSLIERINRTFQYDACLLGLVNVDPDPNGQMNVWLSSASNHQWNPGQKTPETSWEAEIDKLMRAQAATNNFEKRRSSFNRVQEIIAEQLPFIYLVTKNSLVAYSPKLKGIAPSVLRPQLYWNAENIRIEAPQRASR